MSLWGRPGPKFPLNCVLCSTGCSWGGAAAVPPAPLVGPSCLLAAPGPQGGTLGPPRKQVQLLVLTQRGGRVGVFSPRQAGLAADAGPHTPTPTKADQLPPGLQLNVGTRSPGEVAAGAPPWCPPSTSPQDSPWRRRHRGGSAVVSLRPALSRWGTAKVGGGPHPSPRQDPVLCLPLPVSTQQPRGKDTGSPLHTCLKARPPRGGPCSGFHAAGVLSQGEVVPRTPGQGPCRHQHSSPRDLMQGGLCQGGGALTHMEGCVGAGGVHVVRSRSFLEMMEARSRGHASPLTTSGQSPSSGSQSPVVPPSTVSTGSSSPSTPQPVLQPPLQAPPAPPAPAEAPPLPAAPPRRSIIARLFGSTPATEAAPPPPGRPHLQGRPQPQGGPEAGPAFPKGSSPVCLPRPGRDKVPHPPGQAAPQPSRTIPFMGQMGGLVSTSWHPLSPEPTPAAEASQKVQNVEDFVPEDSLDGSFLEDTVPAKDEKRLGARGPQDSDR